MERRYMRCRACKKLTAHTCKETGASIICECEQCGTIREFDEWNSVLRRRVKKVGE